MNSQENTYTKKKKNRLLQGIIWGALAGAAISMLDRNTRESTIACAKKGYQGAREVVADPNQFISQVKETTNKIKTTFDSISEDVAFITNQVEVLREMPPQIASAVKETKEVFSEEESREEIVS